MVKGFTFVASWGVLDLRWHGKESDGSPTAKSVHKRITMAQVEGIVEETLVKKSLDRNIGTITLDNPSKHNARHEGGI